MLIRVLLNLVTLSMSSLILGVYKIRLAKHIKFFWVYITSDNVSI